MNNEKKCICRTENNKSTFQPEGAVPAASSLKSSYIKNEEKLSKERGTLKFAFCWPGCLTVMYDAEAIGLVQIEDIKKNNDYAMWLKVCKKSDCYLLDECLAKYRCGRSGSVSSHSISTMIKWHYKLFREAEKMGAISSLWHTGVNLVCRFYKKMRYVKKKG